MAKRTGLSGLEKTLINLIDEQRELNKKIAKLEKQVGKINERVPIKRGRPPKAAKATTAGRKKPGRKKIRATCSIRGCKESHYSKGLCVNHYQQARRRALKQEAQAVVKKANATPEEKSE